MCWVGFVDAESLYVVCQAWRVWKGVVANTPRTLRAIFGSLMDSIIADLAADDEERQEVTHNP